MNKQQFIQLISNPSGITPEQLAELEKVVAEYPYVQVAHVLIAKATADSGSMFANQKLKKAAAYTQDRKNLKRLLVGGVSKEKDLPLNPIQIKEDVKSTIAGDLPEQRSFVELSPLKQLPKIESEVSSLPSENKDLLTELRENLALLQSRKEKLGIETPEVIIPEESTYLPEEDVLPLKVESTSTPKTLEPLPQENNSKEINPEDTISTSGSVLSNLPTHTSFHQVHPYPIRMEGLLEVESQQLILDYMAYMDEKRLVFRKNKKKEDDIISKIIKEEPRIKKLDIHNLPDNSVDLANKSNFVSKGPISENFAKILALQGKIDHAIEIYEQLIVKNPEKKPYFATQIEKLKNKL